MTQINLTDLSECGRMMLATEVSNPEVLEELAQLELFENQSQVVLLAIIVNPYTSKNTLHKIAENAIDETIRLCAYQKS